MNLKGIYTFSMSAHYVAANSEARIGNPWMAVAARLYKHEIVVITVDGILNPVIRPVKSCVKASTSVWAAYWQWTLANENQR